MKDADVDYVMYKLNSTCTSQILRKKEFERTGDMEGLLVFGGVDYNVGQGRRCYLVWLLRLSSEVGKDASYEY